MVVTGRVRKRVRREFPPEQWEEAERALARCSGGAGERLHVAILNLADGELYELKRLVRHTEVDFRDVLMWGEKPRERRWIRLRQKLTRS